jgi:hypothetical protein
MLLNGNWNLIRQPKGYPPDFKYSLDVKSFFLKYIMWLFKLKVFS